MKSICFVCQNVDCLSRGSEPLLKELTEKVAARYLDVEVKPYICFGGCDHGPNIVLYPQKIWYAGVKQEDLPEILDSMAGGPPVSRLDTFAPALSFPSFAFMFSQLRKHDQSVRNAVDGGPQPIRAVCGTNAETQSRLP